MRILLWLQHFHIEYKSIVIESSIDMELLAEKIFPEWHWFHKTQSWLLHTTHDLNCIHVIHALNNLTNQIKTVF